VLKYDSEDVEAHDMLARCYGEISTINGQRTKPLSAEEISQRLSRALEPKESMAERLQACTEIMDSLPAMPAPRLASIREVIGKLSPAFTTETDTNMRNAIAATLAVAHRESHGIYKPDEIAEANATRIYRSKHPEANYAARARVIYPTTAAHREAIRASGDLPALK
jgi:hypothetical protein